MRIYAVSNMILEKVRGRSYRATWPYHEFYHGLPGGVVNRYGRHPYQPLPLIRNIRLLPQVVFPSISMVVDDSLGGQLSSFAHFDLNPCVWSEVYDHPVDEKAVTQILKQYSPLDARYGDAVRRQLHPPRNHDRLPKWLEIVVPRHEMIVGGFKCDATIELPSAFEDLPPVKTSAELHARFPVIAVETHYVWAEDAFRLIQPFVSDPELFTVLSFDI